MAKLVNSSLETLKNYVKILIEAKLELGTQRISLADADKLAKDLIEELGLSYIDPETITSTSTLMENCGYPVGSIRRRKADIGDLDIIVTAPVTVQEISHLNGVENATGGLKQINFVYTSNNVRRKVNVFVFTDPDTFGAALLFTTGSATYNLRIRKLAKNKNMKLTQHGLYDSNNTLIAGATEKSIQDALGIKNREASAR